MAREGKKERFERIAERRVADLIKKLRLIGNLSNRSNYSYTDAHVRQMFGAIEREVRQARDRFVIKDANHDPSFTFQRSRAEG